MNLLYHRRSVTIDKIKDFCRVSERTAYRYIRALSEANVPVFYDSKRSGYRINESRTIDFGGWIPSEVALIVASLQYLADNLDNDYREDIENLLKRIVTQQSLPFERFWQAWKESLETSKDPNELQRILTSTLINFAVNQNREVNLKLSNQEDNGQLTIKEPVLRFSGNWVVSDAQQLDTRSVPVAEVDSAKVL
jgi:predicted DNA-binding transcriptional regulator YafY